MHNYATLYTRELCYVFRMVNRQRCLPHNKCRFCCSFMQVCLGLLA